MTLVLALADLIFSETGESLLDVLAATWKPSERNPSRALICLLFTLPGVFAAV